jgi:hypothetical protein
MKTFLFCLAEGVDCVEKSSQPEEVLQFLNRLDGTALRYQPHRHRDSQKLKVGVNENEADD